MCCKGMIWLCCLYLTYNVKIIFSIYYKHFTGALFINMVRWHSYIDSAPRSVFYILLFLHRILYPIGMIYDKCLTSIAMYQDIPTSPCHLCKSYTPSSLVCLILTADIVGYIAAKMGYETYKFLDAMEIVGILVTDLTTITDTISWSHQINI